MFYEEDDTNANTALRTLTELYKNDNKWDKIIKEFAAKELIFACNNWAKDENINAKEITKEEFIKRISINTLNVSNDGAFEFEFYDDDLFFGHSIVVNANIDGELISADIVG